MKKHLLIAATLTALAGSEALAGTHILSASATVTLVVLPSYALTKVQNLNFGTVAQGGSSVTILAQSSANAAYFTLAGAPHNQSITITWSATDLTKTGASNITWTPTVFAGSTGTQGSSSQILSSGNTSTTDGSGNLWIWVGGSTATIGGLQVPGTYGATFTLSVDY